MERKYCYLVITTNPCKNHIHGTKDAYMYICFELNVRNNILHFQMNTKFEIIEKPAMRTMADDEHKDDINNFETRIR